MLPYFINEKKKLMSCWFIVNYVLFSLRFFIGYWILKTGLDFYPGPFLFFRQLVIKIVPYNRSPAFTNNC